MKVVHEQAAPVIVAAAAVSASARAMRRINLPLDQADDGRSCLPGWPHSLRSIVTAEEYAVVKSAVLTASLYAVSDPTVSALRLLTWLYVASWICAVMGIVGITGLLSWLSDPSTPPNSAAFVAPLVCFCILAALGAAGVVKCEPSALRYFTIDGQDERMKKELARVGASMNSAERTSQRRAIGLAAPQTRWTMARDPVAVHERVVRDQCSGVLVFATRYTLVGRSQKTRGCSAQRDSAQY